MMLKKKRMTSDTKHCDTTTLNKMRVKNVYIRSMYAFFYILIYIYISLH